MPAPHDVPALADYQARFGAHIRNPRAHPRPAGVPARRMRVYEELLFNNLEGFLLACYPITRKILGARRWKALVRRFFAEHPCASPLFRHIPEEFLGWATLRAGELFPDKPFLAEFLHYEWVELAVSVTPAEPDMARIDPDGDLLRGRPALQPSARVVGYGYPVHRIGPRFQPKLPDPQGWHYLVFRDESDKVRFIVLNPLSARLVQRLLESRDTGADALAFVGATLPQLKPEAVTVGGLVLLASLREQSALMGAWRE